MLFVGRAGPTSEPQLAAMMLASFFSSSATQFSKQCHFVSTSHNNALHIIVLFDPLTRGVLLPLLCDDIRVISFSAVQAVWTLQSASMIIVSSKTSSYVLDTAVACMQPICRDIATEQRSVELLAETSSFLVVRQC